MYKEINIKIKKIAAFVIIFAMLFSFPANVFAFSENEGRSIESFFIETELLKGDGNSYGLEITANRLEATIILIRLMGKEQQALEMGTLPCQFEDVPNWAKGYVNYAYSQNISKGISETLFGVGEPINAVQYITLMLRVLGYDDAAGDFNWQYSVAYAEDLSIIPLDMSLKYGAKGKYTKKDLLETSFCFLEASYKNDSQQLVEKLIADNVIPDNTAAKYGLDVNQFEKLKTSYYEKENFTFEIRQNQVYISGKSLDPEKKWIIAQITEYNTEKDMFDQAASVDSNGNYDMKVILPSIPDGKYYVDVYGNDTRYDYYTSYILSSVTIAKENGNIYLDAAPVYGQNLRNHNGNKISDLDLKMTPTTMSKTESIERIQNLAKEITAGASTDYEKIKAIHDWVANYIYYDKDYLKGKTKSTNINSIAVLDNKYAVCSGYANLFNDLVSSLGIPNRQVIGYALGITGEKNWDVVDKNKAANHVWNQVYLDGRWIIIDATWDSENTYEDGKITNEAKASDLYFDSTIEFFSGTHKIINP